MGCPWLHALLFTSPLPSFIPILIFGPRRNNWPKLSKRTRECSWNKCDFKTRVFSSRRHIQIKVGDNTLEVHSSLGKSAAWLAAAGAYVKSCWHLCTLDGTKRKNDCSQQCPLVNVVTFQGTNSKEQASSTRGLDGKDRISRQMLCGGGGGGGWAITRWC